MHSKIVIKFRAVIGKKLTLQYIYNIYIFFSEIYIAIQTNKKLFTG